MASITAEHHPFNPRPPSPPEAMRRAIRELRMSGFCEQTLGVLDQIARDLEADARSLDDFQLNFMMRLAFQRDSAGMKVEATAGGVA